MKPVDRGGDPDRRACLAYNEEARKERRTFAVPDNSGHVAFNCPEMDYWYHTTFTDPELGASDPVIARNAWRKFLRTEIGRKYLLNPTEGKRMPATGIIIR